VPAIAALCIASHGKNTGYDNGVELLVIPFFFFRVTTQLQYIEDSDSEPVVDVSRKRPACSAVRKQKQTKGAKKLNNQSKKATEKWLLMVGARLPTPIVGGMGYPRIIPPNTSGEEAL